jgi:GDSL-like Lipase/Acylhydrolase family
VPPRRYGRIAAVGTILLACCLAASLWIVVRVRDADASRAVSSVLIEPRPTWAKSLSARPHARPSMLSVATTLSACERRIEDQPQRLPTVAIVGASYTAGVGPNNPELSYAVVLARLLHWNAVIYGVPGAGYVSASQSGRGPMTRMLSQENLRALDPALVIVQAGFDDSGIKTGFEERRVRATVNMIKTEAPSAQIALLTTFDYPAGGSPALYRLDHAIITAGTSADPGVIVMDPLAGQWTYPRAPGNDLHPSMAGDAWIAHEVEAILLAHGVRAAQATSTTPLICDTSVGSGKPRSATT